MSLTISTFRQVFPEFHDPGLYPDVVIEFYDTVALGLLDPTRWGANLLQGESLFVAHHLAMSARDAAVSQAGGVPGEVKGPVTAKGVDKVTVSYDAQAVALTDGGFWNMTSYGIRFLTYALQIGSGGAQL